jgi:hypothetical protein
VPRSSRHLQHLPCARSPVALAEAKAEGATHQDALQTIAGRGRAEKAKTMAETLAAGWKQEAGPHLAQMQAVTARASGGVVGGWWLIGRPPAASR